MKYSKPFPNEEEYIFIIDIEGLSRVKLKVVLPNRFCVYSYFCQY